MPDGSVRTYSWIDVNLDFAELPTALEEALEKQGAAKAPSATQARTSLLPVDVSPDASPLAVLECARLLSSLAPHRAAGEGRNNDWLRVGFALRHNQALLEAAGRPVEASVMEILFDNWSATCTSRYPGSTKTHADFRRFKSEGGITVATLVGMAREDSAVAGRLDPLAAIVAERVQCDPVNVKVRRANSGALQVNTPLGKGVVDLTDMGPADSFRHACG
eukprot:scaffold457271_cov30-Prasinocladus_malaysianus.AAC.4